ncbi:MAG: LON peptidase substrate-binding domain-containing protein [Alphaproteobacteria bacterium]|nr:LON peptidase substrate-binding domain-containing protein [Alphaproteobacteria bacterium]
MTEDSGDDRKVADTLPVRIPIFPLSGVLLLPGAKLPLNIFEPRYLDMVRDAMAGDRIIGMIQPLHKAEDSAAPALYDIGGAGRITSFEETPDSRIQITLTGLSRFSVIEELTATTRYRQVIADWDRFAADRWGEDEGPGVDRDRLLTALRAYLELARIPAEWDAIAKAETGPLITSLAMICPFGPAEKQALLEARDLFERSRIMTALVEMALLQQASGGGADDQDDDDHQIH